MQMVYSSVPMRGATKLFNPKGKADVWYTTAKTEDELKELLASGYRLEVDEPAKAAKADKPEAKPKAPAKAAKAD